jgi:hypothetical protein
VSPKGKRKHKEKRRSPLGPTAKQKRRSKAALLLT